MEEIYSLGELLIGLAAIIISVVALKSNKKIKELADVATELQSQTIALNAQNLYLQNQTIAITDQATSLTKQVELQSKNLLLYEESLLENKPPHFKVKVHTEDPDNGNLTILLTNKGRSAIFETPYFIEVATPDGSEKFFNIKDSFTPADLLPDREPNPTLEGLGQYPFYVEPNETLRLKFERIDGYPGGTGTNLNVIISFIDLEGNKYNQVISGFPWKGFLTGYLQKS